MSRKDTQTKKLLDEDLVTFEVKAVPVHTWLGQFLTRLYTTVKSHLLVRKTIE